jgi:hypothetical protein
MKRRKPPTWQIFLAAVDMVTPLLSRQHLAKPYRF